MSDDMELLEYWLIVRKHWKLIVIIPVIAALVSGAWSVFMLKKQYEADTTLLVNQKPTSQALSLQYDTILANEAMVKTYSNIIKSNTVAQIVVNDLKLPMTSGQLNSMIQVSSPDQSQVIKVSVIAKSQALATEIANRLATVFQKKATAWMDIENVQIVDPATNPTNPVAVKPNKKMNVAIAFILGLLVSLGLAFLLEYLDNRIRNEEDVRRYLNLPVLGTIIEYELVDH